MAAVADSGDSYGHGTHVATLIAGVAASLFSRFPEATAAQVEAAVLASCIPVQVLVCPVACGGIVNAPRALQTLRTMLGG